MDGGMPDVPSNLSVAELAAQITELAGHLNAANYRWLCLIGEFDRRNSWSDGTLKSCAHWLNFKCGLDLGAAREKVRVAHALPTLPKIAAAMARGELSYSKVRALTRVAQEATEDYFLMMALHGTAHHVETLVRHYRRVKEVEELSREGAQQRNRRFSYWFDSDGSLVFNGRLPALAGTALINALDAAMEALPPSDIDPEWPKNVSTPERYQVVVHVDAETLRESTAGRCETNTRRAMAFPETGRQRVQRRQTDKHPGLCMDRFVGRARRARHTYRQPNCRNPLAGRAHGLRARHPGAVAAVRTRRAGPGG
jgi:hypothetical protein